MSSLSEKKEKLKSTFKLSIWILEFHKEETINHKKNPKITTIGPKGNMNACQSLHFKHGNTNVELTNHVQQLIQKGNEYKITITVKYLWLQYINSSK